MYVEDGREIFDEEMGDEDDGHLSTKGSKKDTEATKIKTTTKKGNTYTFLSKLNEWINFHATLYILTPCISCCFTFCLSVEDSNFFFNLKLSDKR